MFSLRVLHVCFRYIGRSLTNNIDQVAITVVFMVVLLYIFAVAGFYFNFA